MGKIYVVTQGEYSAYGICIVTTKKEVAETWIKNHSNDRWCEPVCDFEIEEYDDYDGFATDLEELKKKEKCFKLYANSEKGMISLPNIKDPFEFYEEKEKGSRYDTSEHVHMDWAGRLFGTETIDYVFYIHAESYDKAFKIACDTFAKAEAERQGL